MDYNLSKPIFLISVPKCGTVLLLNIIRKILNINQQTPWLADHELSKKKNFENTLYNGHLYCDEISFKKIAEYKKILLYRDPRDYVVSYANFFNSSSRPPTKLDNFFKENNYTNQDVMIDVIRGVLVDGEFLYGVSKIYNHMFLKWISKNAIPVRYEDITGSNVGGSDKKRNETILKILKFLEINAPNNLGEIIGEGDAKSKEGKYTSFRKGGSGDWKNHFKEHHKLLFKYYASNLVSKLNYEENEDW